MANVINELYKTARNNVPKVYEAGQKSMIDEIKIIEETTSEHINSKGNPHDVTASQVGAYSVSEVNELLDEKASADDVNALKSDLADLREDITGESYFVPIALHYNINTKGENELRPNEINRGITLDYIDAYTDVDVIVPDGYSIARHKYDNGVHTSIDNTWQTGTVRLAKGYKWKFVLNTGTTYYSSEVTELNDLIKQKTDICTIIKETIPHISNFPKIVYNDWTDVTQLLGNPVNKTYFPGEGYTDMSSRCAYLGLLDKEILKATSEIKITINAGYSYSRQVFSHIGDSTSIVNYELFNDTSWQTGETVLDISNYNSPITFAVLRNDGDVSAITGLKVEIYCQNTVETNTESLNELKNDVANIDNSVTNLSADVTKLSADVYGTSMSEYFGEPIQIKAKFKNTLKNTFSFSSTALPTANTGSVQCFAFYNNYIVICFKNGGIAIYSSNYSLIKEYALTQVGSDFHAANCFFYGTNENSDFPYLYISETTGQKRCAVVSLESDSASVVGWLSFSGTFGTGSSDYYDWNYDDVSKHIFLVGYDNYSSSNYHIIVKDLGEITDELTYTYTDSDVKFTKHDYHMSMLQGGCFNNGRLFYVGTGTLGEGLYVYDVYSDNVFKSFVHLRDVESEGCGVNGTSIYYLFTDGNFYQLDFA